MPQKFLSTEQLQFFKFLAVKFKTGIMRIYWMVCCFLFVTTVGFAQSTRDTGTAPPRPIYQASKQKSKRGFLGIFKKKDNTKKVVEEQDKFEERMKAVAKQKAKEARLANKKQYSNKFYFGHKREPKKRKPGKKKWCKICEFAH